MPPRVTALRELSSGVAVELDGVPWRTLPADVVVRSGLGVGRALDRPLARAVGREVRRRRALAAAAGLLRTRDRSVRELEERLRQRPLPEAAREEAVTALQQAGIVDDLRLATSRAQTLAERHWSNAAIAADLEARGIDAETAAAALAGLAPEAQRAAALAARRGATLATARYLAARGFEHEAVEAAVPGLVAGDS